MPTQEEIFTKIQKVMVDALGVDESEVTPEARITADLGAESIDFLDIMFKLEKAFNIKIPRAELFPDNLLTDANYVQDGKLTAVGVDELKKRMPYADLEDFSKNPTVKDFGSLFTVKMICDFVAAKVGA
jgi:acyl carrier protein